MPNQPDVQDPIHPYEHDSISNTPFAQVPDWRELHTANMPIPLRLLRNTNLVFSVTGYPYQLFSLRSPDVEYGGTVYKRLLEINTLQEAIISEDVMITVEGGL